MATLVSDLIFESFLDLGVVAVGESLTAAEQADAFMRLNQYIALLANEQLTIPNVVHQSFTVTAGTSSYTLGTGGTLVTAAQPIRVTGAASVSGAFRRGMKVISHEQFSEQIQDPGGRTEVLGEVLAADMASPTINLRIFPTPAASPGNLLLDYWTPIAQFATVGDTVSLPLGFEAFLHFNLAVQLYNQYGRPGGIDPVLVQNAQMTKASVVALHAQILGLQQAPPPQQQGQQ